MKRRNLIITIILLSVILAGLLAVAVTLPVTSISEEAA